jgi:lipopolysaccharide/colanic/teichoic acid biosynthesis glycosyltransferase
MVGRQVAEGQDYRNRIPAGLTGLAQVTKGEAIPFEKLDLRYLECYDTLSSWALVGYDLQILWRTVVVIARGEGLNY